jgi:mRNA interferase HigB
VRIISRRALRDFWAIHADARQMLQARYADVKQADWKAPADIKRAYHTASFIANNRVVFNLRGNKYRVVVAVQYQFKIVFIRFVGTHQEYDRVDASTV